MKTLMILITLLLSQSSVSVTVQPDYQLTVAILPEHCSYASMLLILQEEYGTSVQMAQGEEFLQSPREYRAQFKSDVYCLGTCAKNQEGKTLVARWDQSSFVDDFHNHKGEEGFRWIPEDDFYPKGSHIAIIFPITEIF